MEILFKSLGQYLRDQRVKKGLTQGEVAHELGYSSPQFVSNFERGLCAPPYSKVGSLIKLYRLNGEEVIRLIVKSYEKELRRELKIMRRP
jgi:transcriptional regulator with XRE-family HTH domain